MHGEFCLHRLGDGERGGGTAEVKQATTVGRDMLVVAGSEAEKVAKFVVATAVALGRAEAPEPAPASDGAFDAPVILFQPVVLERLTSALGNRGRSCGGGADFSSPAWLALIRCGDGATR